MLVFGRNVVREIIKNGVRRIKEIHLVKRITDVNDVISYAAEHKIEVFYKERPDLDKYCGTPKNQGVAAVVEDIKLLDMEDFFDRHKEEKMTIAVLDEIEDPHNFGAIIRSCEVLGVCGIIVGSRRNAPVNETVYKTSSGALDYVDIVEVVNINQAMEQLKKRGFWVYGLDMAADKYLEDVKFDKKTAIVLGNEGKGLRPLISKNCDFLVKIRQQGRLDSLNVSNAAAIVFYQAMVNRGS
ncbi:MAG: 23S rRNA (guanosine(2251)-2'-O)-methyltransferase RlmB [Spirochaetia bacterium]|nr:23S rRNA (guanosine(2251)-2'-O)-methyltransferase RlmB [Spirochaetia bacterium]